MKNLGLLKTFWAALASCALILALLIGGGSYTQSEFIDAGPIITWSNQILNLLNTILGLLATGFVITYGFLVDQHNNEPSVKARPKIRIAGILSLLLGAGYIAKSVTTLAYVLGTNLKQTFAPRLIQTYVWDLTPSRSLLISALLALTSGIWLLAGSSLNSLFGALALLLSAVGYPLLNSHAISLGNHSLAITASVAHALAMSIWVGTAITLIPFVKFREVWVVKRFSTLASFCVAVLLISGIVSAITRMGKFLDLFQSGYGQLVLVKGILFLLIAYCATKVRMNLSANAKSLQFLILEITTMALATGVGVALHFTAPTKNGKAGNSAAEDILGFTFPPAPTVKNYFLGWHPDWVILSLVGIACALYISGLVRVRRKSIAWPYGRSISFIFGMFVLIWATSSGIAKYAMITFSAHMIQHMTLAMLVPIFLVLGAPITLALRALPTAANSNLRSPRDWLVALLHSRYSKAVTNPLLVLFIFTVSLYGLYFTSIFSSLMGSHTGHIAMTLHFLITGILFSYLVVGIDPSPNRLPFWAKLLLVLVSLSIHAFFALAIMQTQKPLGATWFDQVQPPWLTDSLADTHAGGGIAWAIGEIPMLILLVVVAVQWANADTRKASQQDRAAERDNDAELARYNSMLEKLQNTDSG